MTAEPSGPMPCPVCGTADSAVIDTRRAAPGGYGPGIRRRRECANGHRFTTIEKVIQERAQWGHKKTREIAKALSSRIDEVLR